MPEGIEQRNILCKKCGSSHISSNGFRIWICRDCGKQWIKDKYRNPRKTLKEEFSETKFKEYMED